MARDTPRVDGATLIERTDAAQAILVGTPAWYAWLDGATSFAFVGASGHFTARKERRDGANGYWKAYRKCAGVVRSAYLGKTPDLTLERLQVAAATLAEPPMPAGAPPRPDLHLATLIAEPTAGASTALPTGTVTFMFTDIEGSTQLWEQYPQAMHAALARHDAILRQAVALNRGVVFKTVGDSIHAVFARAGDALEAALAAQRGLHAEPWESTDALRVRIALHSGVAEERDGDYFGAVLNRVARILALGHGGQVLLSRATHDLVADDLPLQTSLRDLGAYHLKDLSRPEHVFQMVTPDLPADFPPLHTPNPQPARPPPAATPLLATKLHIPALRPQLVPRPRLLERVQAGLLGKLTLIAAPAGFGKTTVLSEWIALFAASDVRLEAHEAIPHTHTEAHAPYPHAAGIAWLSLETADNDPTRFWRYVIAAIETVRPGVGEPACIALVGPQPPPIETILTVLINALAAGPPEPPLVVLVLDDYHVISTPAIHDALTFLLDQLPSQLRLILTSRADPPLPLARLRARSALTELRAADLRFTPDEVATFLNQVMGLSLVADDLAALEARTEGWIAGLQLAALAMRDHRDRTSFIRTFTGNNRYIVEYLAAEVFASQPAHIQTFLLHTAILDRMCGPLCDAVLGVGGQGSGDEDEIRSNPQHPAPNTEAYSQIVLADLERANLFVVPLDDDCQWYRYHHLFAEVLRQRLTSGATSATVASLHGRASVWYERQGLVSEAVQHALAAADGARAAHLIERHGLRIIGDGQVQTVLGWLRVLPDALLRARPMLFVLHAFALQFTNELTAAEARVQDAEGCIQPDTPPDQAHLIQGYAAMVRANRARYTGDLAGCVAFGQQALELLPETEVVARTVAMLHTARAFRVSGNVTDAQERLVVAVVAPIRASRNLLGTLAAVTNLARMQVLQGRLRAAAATFREAAQLAFGPDELLLVEGPAYYVGMGELLREWNDLDAADQHLAQAMEQLAGRLAVDAEDVALGYLALARVPHARGDHATAHLTLETYTNLARRRGFVAHLVARASAVQAQLALAQGHLAAAIAWAHASGLGAADDLSFPREAEYLILARVWIAQAGNGLAGSLLPQALDLLDRLLEDATTKGRMGSVVDILIVRALALWVQGTRSDALETIERALTLAAPEGYVRRFVDEGPPMVAMLQAAAARGIAPEYVTRLLAAFPSIEGQGLKKEAQELRPPVLSPQSSALVETLTDRELDVLRLVAAGRSNQEIAETLVIAVSTVKKHINNLYGKLAVQTRTQALLRARALNLL